MHHPPVADFQTRINVSHNPRPNEIALRDDIESLAPTMKARIILCAGHIHNYERFLQNQIRQKFGFVGTPIWIKNRPRTKVELGPKKTKRR